MRASHVPLCAVQEQRKEVGLIESATMVLSSFGFCAKPSNECFPFLGCVQTPPRSAQRLIFRGGGGRLGN